MSDETRRRRYVFAVQVSSRILRVHKHRYQFRFGRYFAQQLQLLAYEGVAEKVVPVTFAPQWGGAHYTLWIRGEDLEFAKII